MPAGLEAPLLGGRPFLWKGPLAPISAQERGSVMYAVVMLQGHQFRVEPQALIQVPRLEAQVGTEVPIENVRLVEGDGAVQVGKPVVGGAKVVAEVVRHLRGPKVKGVKFKKRKDYRRRWGQRSDLTELRIRSIT